MTGELERFLRETFAKIGRATVARTTPGIGPGQWDSSTLARDQINAATRHEDDSNAPAFNASKTLYRLYTEDLNRHQTRDIVRRYFAGATLYYGIGLDARTQLADEECLIIDIVSSAPDSLQRVLDLAGDIRAHNRQISVLVTRQTVTTFEVTMSDAERAEETERLHAELRDRR